MSSVSALATSHEQISIVRLDVGCGNNKKEGFHGVDRIAFPGVDTVCDVGSSALPFGDSSVDEVHSSHFLEHLTAQERCQFVNELWRVLKPGAKATIITPHWASNRAYGDPTHQWPAVSEMWFYYLSKEWRKANAPHTDKEHWPPGFDCDFEATWGYSMHPSLGVRNDAYKQEAMTWWKDAIQDTIATLTARKPA